MDPLRSPYLRLARVWLGGLPWHSPAEDLQGEHQAATGAQGSLISGTFFYVFSPYIQLLAQGG